MSKMHQISENDLADLERLIPSILDRQMHNLSTTDKVASRRIKMILSDVRWNYGPPDIVERIND